MASCFSYVCFWHLSSSKHLTLNIQGGGPTGFSPDMEVLYMLFERRKKDISQKEYKILQFPEYNSFGPPFCVCQIVNPYEGLFIQFWNLQAQYVQILQMWKKTSFGRTLHCQVRFLIPVPILMDDPVDEPSKDEMGSAWDLSMCPLRVAWNEI